MSEIFAFPAVEEDGKYCGCCGCYGNAAGNGGRRSYDSRLSKGVQVATSVIKTAQVADREY